MNVPAIFRRQPREMGALTGFRGLGSLWVLVAHLSLQLHPVRQATGPLEYLIDGAYLGVDIFFILSGFVIASNYQEFFQKWDYRQYFRFQILRLGRIYPLHLVMLFATLAFVIIAGILGRQINNAVTGNWDFSVASFVANLLLVQNWATAQISWNGPAWSISAEWFAYLVFPLVAYRLLRRLETRRTKIAVVTAACGTLIVCTTWFYSESLFMLPLLRGTAGFLSGVIVWMWVRDHPPTAGRRPQAALVATVGLIAALVATGAMGLPVGYWPAPLLVLFVFGLTVDAGPVARVFASAPAIFLGRISYSLYLSHIWVIYGVRTFVAPAFDSSLYEAVVVVLSPLISIPVATVLFLMVEEPWRKRAKILVRDQRPRAVPVPAAGD